MKISDKEELQNSKNLFGGLIRWSLSYTYAFLLRKEKPKRTDYTVPPNVEKDYLGHTNTDFKNGIAIIIAGFILLSILFKVFRSLT